MMLLSRTTLAFLAAGLTRSCWRLWMNFLSVSSDISFTVVPINWWKGKSSNDRLGKEEVVSVGEGFWSEFEKFIVKSRD